MPTVRTNLYLTLLDNRYVMNVKSVAIERNFEFGMHLCSDMGKYNKTLHYNNQQSKLYWVEAPYNNFWCWLFWGTLHTTFKNVVVGLVLVGTKNYNFVK